MKPSAILFDAYGTLLDVMSVAEAAEYLVPGKGAALSALWREKQLQYTWLRSLADHYADFRQVTEEALDYSAAALDVQLSDAQRAGLVDQYERLAQFADVAPALDALRASGVPLAVLSNGTSPMLEAVFSHAGLRDRFEALLSVDSVKRYKPSPDAYGIAVDHFGAAPSELLLVSSNGWDIAGAAMFGFGTFWINRGALPVERLGVTPTGMGRTLADLLPWLTGIA